MPKPITRIVALLTVVIAGGEAPAQQPAVELEEVVTVGTRGEGRRPLDSPVPVDVIRADDIQNISAYGGELGKVLLAAAPSFNFPRQSNVGSADHIRAAQLRGMSPDQVLVLVNGKRQHTAAVVNLEAEVGRGTTPFDFNSIPVTAIERIEVLRDGAGAQYGSDAIAGVINIVLKDAPEGGSLAAFFGAHRTDLAPTGDSITDGQTFSVSGDYGFAVGEGGSLRIGGEYRDRNSTNRAGIGVLPFFEDQTPANLALSPARLFAPGDGESEDLYAFYNFNLPVAGDRNIYSFGRLNQRDSTGAAFFRWPDGFSGVPSVYPNGYRPVTNGDNTDLSFSGGLEGVRGEWDWDFSATIGRNDYELGVSNSINPSFGAASPTSFKLAGFEFTQTTLNADLVRPIEIADLFGGATLALGAELRFEDYQTTPGDPQSFQAGPLAGMAAVGAEAGPGLDTDSVADIDRFVYSAYVQLDAAATEKLELSVAVRFEDYDDFGSAVTGKLSGIYELNETLALRGALGRNFRAPSLAQTGFEFSTTNFGAGGMLTVFGHLPVFDPVAIANGALPLKEERANNVSAGLVWEASDNISITIDLFNIDVNDRITLIAGSRDNVTFFTNLVDTKTNGIDIVANGSVALGNGDIAWTAAYNRSDTDVENPQILGEQEINTLETAAPKDKVILQGVWNSGRWSVLGRATRFGETVRDFDFGGGFPDAQTHSDVWSLDVEVDFEPRDNWHIALGAENLLDEYPDLSSSDNNFFGHLPYDIFPAIGMNGAFFYVRARIDY